MPQRDPAESSTKPHWTVASVALFVIGLLILVPSGLCTAVGLVYGIASLAVGDFSLLSMVLTIGGVPVALGIGLVVISLGMRRKA